MSQDEQKQSPKLPELDPSGLAEIEREACLLAKEFCKLNKQLQVQLNHISAASVCNMQTCHQTVDRLCDSVDQCVQEEQNLRKKAAELSRSMEPIYKLQTKINTIKTVLTTLETQI